MSCESMKFRALLLMLLGLSTLSTPVVARDCNDCSDFSSCSNSCDRDCSNSCSFSRDCSNSCDRDCSNSCSNSCSVSCSDISCKDDCSARTTFIPRQVTFDPTYELGLNNYWHYYNNAPVRPFAYLHLVPFFQKTRNGNGLARCIFPGRSSLSVREDGTGDINSLWLGLVTGQGQSPFASRISICPESKTVGAVLYAYFDLCSFCDGLWASFNFTPMRVQNRLNFRERLESEEGVVPGRGTVRDVLTSNRFLHYGRFYNGCISRTGVDDIQFKWGYNFWDTECGHFGAYWVTGIPTGRSLNGRHIFEPVVGSKHWSLGFGLNADYMVWQCGNQNFNIMADFKYRYAFEHNEVRSLDFCCNGEFSRFLPLVTFEDRCPGDEAAAVNFFTRCVSVKPRSTIDFWLAAHYEWCGWNLELGYTLWWRDREIVHFINRCNTRKDLGIYDLASVCGGASTTASTATIATPFADVVSDAAFTNVDSSDLNPCSTAQPRVLTNKVYGAASYNGLWCDTPWMIGILGSGEFANRRCALEQWAVAVNLSVGF